MAAIIGTTPPKPAAAHNVTGHRPTPIDSRTRPGLANNDADGETLRAVSALKTALQGAGVEVVASLGLKWINETLRALAAAAAQPSTPARNAARVPTDVPSLLALHANAEARLLAAQIIQAGGAGAGITLDDLAKLPMQRLRELKQRRAAAPRLQGIVNAGTVPAGLADTFITHRVQHEAAAGK